MYVKRALQFCLLFLPYLVAHGPIARGQAVSAPTPQPGVVTGTVTDVDGAAVPGATVVVADHAEVRPVVADGVGFFTLAGVPSSVPVYILITAKAFAPWTSPELTLTPGQAVNLPGIKLPLAAVTTTVNAITQETLAVEEVKEEESQRVFGIFPNFYVSYDAHFVPLSAKLKFQLAIKGGTDPIAFVAAAFLAGINQAADTPAFVQGAKGFGQRMGAAYADGFSDIMIGGAILPALLHQDPRYFYQGTGTKKSRMLHAVEAPFVARRDDGGNDFNYSSVGGDLLSAALTNVYYPPSSRGYGTTFSNAAITTGARIANTLAQEFLFHRVTKSKPQPDVVTH